VGPLPQRRLAEPRGSPEEANPWQILSEQRRDVVRVSLALAGCWHSRSLVF